MMNCITKPLTVIGIPVEGYEVVGKNFSFRRCLCMYSYVLYVQLLLDFIQQRKDKKCTINDSQCVEL